MSDDIMTIGTLAKRAGVKRSTVRYYERRGLLPAPARRRSGYREYTDEHVHRLRFIRRAQALGFTLAEIRELMALRVEPAGQAGDVRRRVVRKLEDVEARIRDLEALRAVLLELVGACAGAGSTAACPILEALAEGSEKLIPPETPHQGARRNPS